MGIIEIIDSFIFILINEYFFGRIFFYYFDLYCLESLEIEVLNLEIYWEGLEVFLGIFVIEWVEKLVYYFLDFL